MFDRVCPLLVQSIHDDMWDMWSNYAHKSVDYWGWAIHSSVAKQVEPIVVWEQVQENTPIQL